MTVGMDLVCSCVGNSKAYPLWMYVGGWLCRLFWHHLLNLGASVPGGGWSASGVFVVGSCV